MANENYCETEGVLYSMQLQLPYIYCLSNRIHKRTTEKTKRVLAHPLTSNKSHLSVPLLQVLTLRNSGSWNCL